MKIDDNPWKLVEIDENDMNLNKRRGPVGISISPFVKIPSIPIGILGIWASDGDPFSSPK